MMSRMRPRFNPHHGYNYRPSRMVPSRNSLPPHLAEPSKLRPYMPRESFDIESCSAAFTQNADKSKETEFQQALMKRNQDLLPTSVEQTALCTLISKVSSVLDSLIVAPGNFTACKIEEHREVGSYKRGTMLTGHNVADIVVILKTLPTSVAVTSLTTKLYELLLPDNDDITVNVLDQSAGCDIATKDATVRIIVTTLHNNMRLLDQRYHVNEAILRDHLATIRHIRWFEQNATFSTIKVLIRLLKDLCHRFPGLSALSPWAIDLLAHHCVMVNPTHTRLAIEVAFRRALQLLAAGIFLPGSSGILDPCEGHGQRIHTRMSRTEQDVVCLTAQTILRVLLHGAYRQVLGLEETPDIECETMCEGVRLRLLEPVCKPEKTEEVDNKEGEQVADGAAVSVKPPWVKCEEETGSGARQEGDGAAVPDKCEEDQSETRPEEGGGSGGEVAQAMDMAES